VKSKERKIFTHLNLKEQHKTENSRKLLRFSIFYRKNKLFITFQLPTEREEEDERENGV
jgi:hypothetical protein